MANIDNPNGFQRCENFAGHSEMKKLTCTALQTIADGDAIIHSSGVAQIALATSDLLLGVSASPVTAADATDDWILYHPGLPWYVFEGQCSGTYSIASYRFVACDIEGATGVMEVNENATSEECITIIGEDPNSEIGLNTRVYFLIIRSQYLPLLAAK